MTPKKIGAGILSTGALILGGVDASVLNEQPISRIEIVANERVEAKQIGNVIETTLPWKDQAGLKVKVDLGEPTISERLADKRRKEVITETVSDFDGGFKVDILLNERPDTNVFCYDIEGAENYDFFYQPPLTEAEIAEGASRPENIEGSYAVYHKTLANHRVGAENYATGKVMHIPRPQVWELNNKETTTEWAELSYTDTDGLCVTVRQEFLDKAEYPVRVDPTFGYTSAGATAYGLCNVTSDRSGRFGYTQVSPDSGSITLVSTYLARNVAAARSVDTVVFINQENSGGSGNHGQIATAENSPISYPASTAAAQYDFTMANEAISASTNYVLSAACDGNDLATGGVNIFSDAVSSVNGYLENFTGASSYTNAKESPWTETATASTTYYSIYATYTASGGDPATSTDSGIIWFD